MSLPAGKVVYLDQKGWIDLARSSKETVNVVINASESGSAIFPLSIVHMHETCGIPNPRRRQNLASLMVKISKGYSFSPYVDVIIEAEIRQEVLKRLGFPTIDLRKHILGKGICHMIGTKPEIVKRKGVDAPDQPPDQVKKKMLDVLDTPEAMLLALTGSYRSRAVIQDYIETVEKMEHIRQDLLKIKDNTMRRRAVFAKFLIDIIGLKLAKVHAELNIPKDAILVKDWSERDFEEFLDRIPTALCLFTLLLERDQQLQRPIEVNDIADVWALSLAIPYSDIVVTETMWTSISKQAKLDKKCNTTILTSINELIGYL